MPVRQFRLERDCLLATKPLEVRRPARFLKAGKRLFYPVDGRRIAPHRLLQLAEILLLDPLVYGVGFRHGFACLSKSKFREGVERPFSRPFRYSRQEWMSNNARARMTASGSTVEARGAPAARINSPCR